MARLSALILATTAAALALVAPAGALQHRAVCPLNVRGHVRPADLRSGVRKTMVPRGAGSLMVCSYNGVNTSGGAPKFGLLGEGMTTDQVTIRHLTNELNTLKPTHGVYNCPAATGSQDVATFVYRTGPSVVVTVGTSGCSVISNGHVTRMGVGSNSRVVPQVSALAKPLGGGPA